MLFLSGSVIVLGNPNCKIYDGLTWYKSVVLEVYDGDNPYEDVVLDKVAHTNDVPGR